MEEYLIPNKYKGNGHGISIMFAGLNQTKYELLEISIDGVNYIAVERESENPYNSKPLELTGLEHGMLYKVYGRFTADNVINNIECNVLSQDGNDADVFNIEAIKKSSVSVESSNIQSPIVTV